MVNLIIPILSLRLQARACTGFVFQRRNPALGWPLGISGKILMKAQLIGGFLVRNKKS
jgi:hypothetical protein